jgi:AraC-like DNA-binding protein
MTNSRRGPTARPFGTGRIIFWRGGSLWIGHAGEETGFHEHHAIQITLTLSGDTVRLRSPEHAWVSYEAAIVAAHQSHAFEARGELVALVFAEPESLEGRALRQRYPEGVSVLDASALAEEAVHLATLFARNATDDALAHCARAITTRLSSIHVSSAKPLDKRIMRAIDLLRERIADTVTMTEIADAVHLSAGRFRHLFLQETGIRFRPYVLWLRLEVAVAAYAAGSSLTEASHAGGFADSAHFSRTFKRMFGVTAIGVQRV